MRAAHQHNCNENLCRNDRGKPSHVGVNRTVDEKPKTGSTILNFVKAVEIYPRNKNERAVIT